MRVLYLVLDLYNSNPLQFVTLLVVLLISLCVICVLAALCIKSVKRTNSISSTTIGQTAETEAEIRKRLSQYRKMYNIPDTSNQQLYLTAGIISAYKPSATPHELSIVKSLVESRVFNPNCIFLDTYLKTKTGATVQVDVIAVGKRGVFVFESKDFSGWIYGNGNQTKWTNVLYRERYRFYNPVKQNASHISALRNILGKVKFRSLIVFGDDATLKDISYIPKDTYVLTSRRLFEALIDICGEPECLSSQEVIKICQTIHVKRLNPDEAVRGGHVDSIKEITGEKRVYD